MTTDYRSRIDPWFVAILLLAAVLCVYAAVSVAAVATLWDWVILVAVLMVSIGLPIWLLSSTRYTLTTRELLVRSGPLHWTIPIAEIRSITPTSSPLASPALSLDRLRIDYGKDRSLMISPRDQAGFLRDIEALRSDPVGSAPQPPR